MKTILEVNKDYVPDYHTDYIGAVAALYRLQDTFGITAKEIAEGKIRGGQMLLSICLIFFICLAFVTFFTPMK